MFQIMKVNYIYPKKSYENQFANLDSRMKENL